MSDIDKVKETPKPPQEQAKEPSVPKTSQSAFDKVLEQQKILQQSPVLQSKVADQGATEYKVKEVGQQQDKSEDKQKKEERDESGSREKVKQKEKGSQTVTKEAVTRGGEKKGFGNSSGGGGGKGRDGFGGGDQTRRQIIDKKMADIRGMMNAFGKSSFAGKLAMANAQPAKLDPKQMQVLVNQIVQAIRLGKNELGEKEMTIALKDNVFKGLRLRFTNKDGKVLVQFETKTRDVKDLFTKEASKIKAALEEKGVKVSEIKVLLN